MTVITDVSAGDVQCQDELALAYISNSSIFPVSLKKYREIAPTLDGGMYVNIQCKIYSYSMASRETVKLLSRRIRRSLGKMLPMVEGRGQQFPRASP